MRRVQVRRVQVRRVQVSETGTGETGTGETGTGETGTGAPKAVYYTQNKQCICLLGFCHCFYSKSRSPPPGQSPVSLLDTSFDI